MVPRTESVDPQYLKRASFFTIISLTAEIRKAQLDLNNPGTSTYVLGLEPAASRLEDAFSYSLNYFYSCKNWRSRKVRKI